MNSTSSCPGCGKYIRDDAPEGLCSACLLTFAVRGFPDDASSFSTGTATPKPGRAVNAWRFGDYELLEEIARGGLDWSAPPYPAATNLLIAPLVFDLRREAGPGSR